MVNDQDWRETKKLAKSTYPPSHPNLSGSSGAQNKS